MKKTLIVLLALVATLSVSMAQTIVNTGFTSPYSNGDLASQQGWIAMPNTGANAFDVTDAAGSGFADTVPTTLNTNTGNYVYRLTTGLGNAVSDEWDGVMDFTLSVPVPDIASGDAFRIGLSTSATNALGTGAVALPLRINSTASGDISINGSDAAGAALPMLTIDAATLGWEPAATNLVTDQWRLSWKLRKTTVSDTYTMTCSMSNLTSGATNLTGSGVSMVKTDAYAASGLYTVMGRPQFAEFNDTNSVNITINNLSVIKSAGNPVALYPTPVIAEAGDSVVNLSWADVTEASSYDVKRSDTIDGTYSVVSGGSGITTNVFSDATAVNGNTYYYKITSINGAITADSDPAEAAPDAPVTGLFLDTTFDTADGYTDGDLAEQDNWKAITGEGTDDKAFNVIATGDGFAETATYSNEFSNVLDRQVYYNKLNENTETAQWDGSVTFRLESSPEPGVFATNIVGTVTNIQQIAKIDRGQVFDFGLSSDTSAGLDANGAKDVLINVRVQNDADIDFGLNGYNATQNTMLELASEVVGWDPEWSNGNETNAPTFNTEWITLNWSIRKTAVTNTYSATVSAIIGGVTNSGIYQYTDTEDANQPEDAYIAETMRFAMGHSKEANGITAAGNGATNEIIQVNVDAVSVTHTNASDITPSAAYDLTASLGDLSVTLDWLGDVEADSFDVYRSDMNKDSLAFLANVSGNSYTDTGLNNLTTYFYAVVAKYDGVGDSAFSDTVIIRALGFTTALSWNSVGVVDSNYDLPLSSSSTANGVLTVLGTYTDGAILSPGEGPGNYSGTAVYGVIQKGVETGTPAMKTLRMRSNYYDNRVNGAGVDAGAGSTLLYVKAAGSLNMVTTTYQYEMTANNDAPYRAAFRDSSSGKWYVSDTLYDASAINIADMADPANEWRELTVATLNATSLMNGTNNSTVTPSFTSVDAVGLFADNSTVNLRPLTLLVKSGSAPSAYNLWTDSFGMYGIPDAARTNDYDGDGFSNAWEWGLGGNPTNPNGWGIRRAGFEQVGSDVVYIYPRLKSTDRPDYFLTETDDLVSPDFQDQEVDYTITAGGTWPDEPDFEAVTNVIPTADAVKFIKLNIE